MSAIQPFDGDVEIFGVLLAGRQRLRLRLPQLVEKQQRENRGDAENGSGVTETPRNREATENSFVEDGWFVTGDRVTLGEDGWITFADRDKDMLKVGGENVAASEIERVVATVGGVYENAVVARKDRMLDEVPVVFVIPAPDLGPEAHEALKTRILDECRDKLADFKRPRDVFVVSEMPQDRSGPTESKACRPECSSPIPTATRGPHSGSN